MSRDIKTEVVCLSTLPEHSDPGTVMVGVLLPAAEVPNLHLGLAVVLNLPDAA